MRRFPLLAITVMTLALSAPSCAVKPIKNERAGMFDRLAQGSTGRKYQAIEVADSSSSAGDDSSERVPTVELRKLAFEWPLKSVQITSQYGRRGDGFHEGVDLRAKIGTPVYAAQSGIVIHSGSRLSGYGKMIVLRHKDGWATIYAHNSRLLVRQGSQVKKGQKIAISGKSGRTSGPHLHFEVRKGVSAFDPLDVIGKPSVAMASARKTGNKVSQSRKLNDEVDQDFKPKNRRDSSRKKGPPPAARYVRASGPTSDGLTD